MYVPKAHEDCAACDSASLRQFDGSPVHLALLDATGGIIFLNESFKSWLKAVAREHDADGNLLEAIAGVLRRSRSLAAAQLAAFLSSSVDSMAVTVEMPFNDAPQWFSINGTRFMSGEDARLLFVIENVTHTYEAERMAKDLRSRLLTSQEDERQLISEELHDSTVQHLVAVDLNLMRLKSRLGTDADAQEIMGDIETSVGRAIQELRVSTYLLHPPDLESDGLALALRRYCDGFARRTSLSVRFDCDAGVDEIISSAQKCILRIVQEALTNVHRHAKASQVVVRCRAHNGHMHIVVSDKGSERDMGKLAHVRAGVGLASMRMRLAQFGGCMTMSAARRGTVLHCVLPLHAICKAAQPPVTRPVLVGRPLDLLAEGYPH